VPDRAEELDEGLLRALGDELMRMTARRTNTYAGAVMENSAFRVLRVLEELGPRTLRELSDDLQLELSTVNRQVNAAIRHGHVERLPVRGRAGRLVRPTEAGHRAYLHDGRLRGTLYAQALDELGPERAAAMVESLRAFNDALDRAHEHEEPRRTP
jgi:DNA-binding MarR family transcriptional regulator